ncbi:unnamed protein product [Acanthosepion pharaonis]|uniref:Uncharacterized protein n=1 Tax=Acanthosepion pharaonis TaxID=158019 RepID=A0A812C6M3_ACAPH|nr:unnamed protein product [Sepia pharaonis]
MTVHFLLYRFFAYFSLFCFPIGCCSFSSSLLIHALFFQFPFRIDLIISFLITYCSKSLSLSLFVACCLYLVAYCSFFLSFSSRIFFFFLFTLLIFISNFLFHFFLYFLCHILLRIDLVLRYYHLTHIIYIINSLQFLPLPPRIPPPPTQFFFMRVPHPHPISLTPPLFPKILSVLLPTSWPPSRSPTIPPRRRCLFTPDLLLWSAHVDKPPPPLSHTAPLAFSVKPSQQTTLLLQPSSPHPTFHPQTTS